MILLFLNADDSQHWWQADASGRITARGDGAPPTDPQTIAIPPLDAVSLHRIHLPRLAAPQANAASRLMASELSAAPLESLHTAITAPDSSGQRWLAITAYDAMASWTQRLTAQSITAPLVPAPLLLPAPGTLTLGSLQLVHTAVQAFAAEPDLAATLLGAEAPPTATEASLFTATPPLDLHQGKFARSQRFQPAPQQLRLLSLLAASIALLWVAGSTAQWWQAARAATAAEQSRDALAATLLPPGTPITDARTQVAQRLARTSSGAASRLTAPLLTSLASRPSISLAALSLDGQVLTATLAAASPGDVAAIEADLRAQGLTPSTGLPRTVAGQPQVDLTVDFGVTRP